MRTHSNLSLFCICLLFQFNNFLLNLLISFMLRVKLVVWLFTPGSWTTVHTWNLFKILFYSSIWRSKKRGVTNRVRDFGGFLQLVQDPTRFIHKFNYSSFFSSNFHHFLSCGNTSIKPLISSITCCIRVFYTNGYILETLGLFVSHVGLVGLKLN